MHVTVLILFKLISTYRLCILHSCICVVSICAVFCFSA
uniref:Uncharacterized protein n=1 Tax=Arundo donax TaxID=35708 RepID=A0A0A9A0W6_ARUDO